jgi:hypothetical protein
LKSRTLVIRCEPGQATLLAEALTAYAEAAYPRGGSECAQAARETLLDSAAVIARDAGGDGAAVSQRQRGLIKTAVKWYWEERGQPGQAQALLDLLER